MAEVGHPSLTCRKTFCMTVNKYVFLVHNSKTHFDMPVFPKCSNHTFLNRSSTSTTNGNAHLIMTAQTIELILKTEHTFLFVACNSQHSSNR
jgi:hypothetical protein